MCMCIFMFMYLFIYVKTDGRFFVCYYHFGVNVLCCVPLSIYSAPPFRIHPTAMLPIGIFVPVYCYECQNSGVKCWKRYISIHTLIFFMIDSCFYI